MKRIAIVLSCALLVACNSPVTVSNEKGPKFQIVSDAKGGAVWKLNTATGELWVCAPSEAKIVCVKADADSPPSK